MAWNEPGSGGNKRRDPWQGGGGNEPPDLERLLQRWREFFAKLGAGGGGNGAGGGSGGGGGGGFGAAPILLGVVLLAWFALDSANQIDESRRGVVLRFGKFDRIMGPGLNFKWPRPIEEVIVVETTRVRSTSDKVKMLTSDENIVIVEFNVQYSVADPVLFAFGVRDPEETLRQAAESAVRQVIGNATMDVILSGERTALALRARDQLRQSLDLYGAGVAVSEFNFQNLRPPPEVKEAFDDAITAREDKQRIENEANAYASKVVPEARGQAARVRAEAEGQKAASVADAEGMAKRFTLLVDQYKLAPQVTRKRLYIETMQKVLEGSQKIMVGDENKVLLLQGDRLGGSEAPTALAPAAALLAPVPQVEAVKPKPDRRGSREGSR